MFELWQETGPLAYLILPAGALALLFAALYLRAGARRHFAAAVGSTATTLLLGVTAFATGAHRAVMAMPRLDADDRWLAMMGVGESFSCFIISLAFAVMASILLTVGAYRANRAREQADAASVPVSA